MAKSRTLQRRSNRTTQAESQRDWRMPNRPLFLTMDGLGSVVLALLLWELRMTVYTYAGVGVVLAICIFVFIWLLPLKIAHAKFLRVAICIIAAILLASVLVPSGIERFSSSETFVQTRPASDQVINGNENNIITGNNNTVQAPSTKLGCSTVHIGHIEAARNRGGGILTKGCVDLNIDSGNIHDNGGPAVKSINKQ